MTIVTHGVVRGNMIELRESPGIADGEEVEVVLRAKTPSPAWGEGILRSAGAGADIPGFDEAFSQVERDRRAAKLREPQI